MAATMYRPSLSAEHLSYIHQLIVEQADPAYADLQKYLQTFMFKIGIGVINPAYVADPRRSTLDALDESAVDEESAYVKWTQNPALCSKKELKAVADYRYRNDMMTAAEETAYEQAGV